MSKLKNLASLIRGDLKGDPELPIRSVNSIYKAKSDEISFLAKDSIDLNKVHAAALVVKRGKNIDHANQILVDNPYLAFAQLLEHFFPKKKFNIGIDHNCRIAESAKLGKDVSVGAFSYVGEKTEIGDKTEIHSNVSIYNNVKIGKNCLIYANVVLREDVVLGDNVIIQPGAVIGADGFGFTRPSEAELVKIPQKGKVIIRDNCEIGANTCIDRSTIEETLLKEGVKLDNLIQIGHNVTIGRNTVISSLSGISGSTDIGSNVIMAGQVGVGDHLEIADGVMIAGKTGVTGNIKQKSIVAGYPYQEIRKWRRNNVIIRNMEQYIDRIKALEKKIKELEKK